LGTGAGVILTAVATTSTMGVVESANAASAVQDTVNIDSFLRSGVDAGGGMGVSSQAGKSRPVTGVFLRDETDVFRDKRTGAVTAEIILTNDTTGDNMATLIQYTSPWPLATGGFYDIECRDSKTSEGAFVQVTPKIVGKKSLDEIPFILDCVFAPSGRFSFYGVPTDIKLKKSVLLAGADGGAYRILDVNFSTLSQATQSELPRKAQIIATIPKGSSQMVLLIASAPAVRWKKNGADQNVYSTIESFRAVAAPKSNLKIRRKKNTMDLDFD